MIHSPHLCFFAGRRCPLLPGSGEDSLWQRPCHLQWFPRNHEGIQEPEVNWAKEIPALYFPFKIEAELEKCYLVVLWRTVIAFILFEFLIFLATLLYCIYLYKRIYIMLFYSPSGENLILRTLRLQFILWGLCPVKWHQPFLDTMQVILHFWPPGLLWAHPPDFSCPFPNHI